MSNGPWANYGDRLYTTHIFTPLMLMGRTISVNSATYNGDGADRFYPRGMHCIIRITNGIAPADLIVTIDGQASGALLTSNTLTTLNTTTVLKIYPGILAVPNVSANDILSPDWRIEVVAGNANLITYEVKTILFM